MLTWPNSNTHTTTLSYDHEGENTLVGGGTTLVTTVGYNDMGQLKRLALNNGLTTWYGYLGYLGAVRQAHSCLGPLLGPVFQTVPHVSASHQPGFHSPPRHFSRGIVAWRTIWGMETYQIQEGAVLYYLTFTVIESLPVFVAEEPCQILTDSLNYCHHHKSLRLNAFVLMPTPCLYHAQTAPPYIQHGRTRSSLSPL